MSVRHLVRISAATAVIAALAATPAAAHTGLGSAFSFASGFAHPFYGLDHVLAMVAVGLLAALIGGRALWLVPASFMIAMAAGGALGFMQMTLPGVEQGIVGSVIILGLVIAFARRMPTGFAMALAGAFAVFHGYAHGTEIPASASELSYGLGFVIATGMLHAIGVALGIGAERLSPDAGRTAVRAGGGAIAALGVVLFLV